MTNSDRNATARLEREIEREREQRHKNDEARAGIVDNDERLKDARDSASSGQLKRSRPH